MYGGSILVEIIDGNYSQNFHARCVTAEESHHGQGKRKEGPGPITL